MGISAHQDFWLTGSRLIFIRDAVNGVEQPPIDLGVITPVSPAIAPEEATLEDSDGGLKRVVARAITKYDESYEIVCSNLNIDNLALMFSSDPAEAFTQASTPLTNVVHYAHPGKLVKLKNASGVLMYGITSIQAVTGPGGSPAYVENTDWEIVSLERGLIRMLDSGETDAFDTAGNIEIDFTPRAITGNRLINPQTAGGTVEGTGILIWGRGNNAQQTVREARVSLTPTSAAFSDTNFSNFTLKMSVLNDLTEAIPAGRLVYFLGDMPDPS